MENSTVFHFNHSLLPGWVGGGLDEINATQVVVVVEIEVRVELGHTYLTNNIVKNSYLILENQDLDLPLYSCVAFLLSTINSYFMVTAEKFLCLISNPM